MNKFHREGIKHSSHIDHVIPDKTFTALCIRDSIEFIKQFPDSSIQLLVLDPPYNLNMAEWDNFTEYISWAKQWLNEIERVLLPSGNCVIFGGFQFQDIKRGDLLEIIHYLRHSSNLRLINLIIWYYKNGMGAHRFFSNRHEEIAWFSKTNKYYFDLDSVREKFDDNTLKTYLRDKRLNPEHLKKGKNPTNVWQIGRLNGNSLERVGHPTQKPKEVIRRIIRSLSYPGSLVVDLFAGSGSTGVVSIEEKRNCILVDNDKEMINCFKSLKNKKKCNYHSEILIDPEIKKLLKDNMI
jgi:site-specific DNA-methyltransferase (adenine-specific)